MRRGLKKFLISCLCGAFVLTTLVPPSSAQVVFNLPQPGAMIALSPSFKPALFKGLTVHADNPLRFDFIVDTGDAKLQGADLKRETTKLVKYFLAALTVPEKELWVNLSPYEKDRIIPDKLGQTLMGRDMLVQDYLLKQISSSLMYPEGDLGKKFWDKIYTQAREKFGSSVIPVDTFNKIWITPEKVVVYENGQNVFVVKAHLKAWLDKDYLASEQSGEEKKKNTEQVASENIIREVILPAVEKEVNEGKTFAGLRQIYNAMILATWYKRNLKKSLLSKSYVDKNKINGVDVEDKNVKQRIYDEYVKAFQRGVYNYIKEDVDPVTQQVVPRKYFSGGLGAVTDLAALNDPQQLDDQTKASLLDASGNVEVAVDLVSSGRDHAQADAGMLTREFKHVTIDKLKSEPTLVLSGLVDWLKTKRWFVDKEREIENIELGDSFQLELGNGLSADCLSVVFHLKGLDQVLRTKKYFIPVIISSNKIEEIDEGNVVELSLKDGNQYLSLAENSLLFQRAVVESFRAGRTLKTRNGGTIGFTRYGSVLKGVNPDTLVSKPLNVSTSNLVFSLSAVDRDLLFKVYKDMRGHEAYSDTYWPSNMEMKRYEALASSEYSHMPFLHGVSYYQTPDGHRFPLMVVVDTVKNEGEVGGVFWFGLSDLLNGAKSSVPAIDSNIKGMAHFSRELAKTIAQMHGDFTRSNKQGFEVKEVSSQEISTTVKSVLNRFTKGMVALKARAEKENNATLNHLVELLEGIAPYLARGDIESAEPDGALPSALQNLHGFDGSLMKGEVHGDLSGAQGLIESQGATSKSEQFLQAMRDHDEDLIGKTSTELISRVRWIDFEGEPAKDTVPENYDTRQSQFIDVASFIEGLWYTINVKAYVELGLNPKENPQDKETARKISLVLAGQMKFEDVGIKGLDPHMVSALSQWLNTVSDAFIEGYLDEVEAQGIQGNLLKGEWNREKAKFLIYYWVVARAFHELRYEVYARDEGWEAIPGARILQVVQEKLGAKASATAMDAAERPLTYATSPLQVVDNPPAQNRFFAPIDAGRREDVIFFPFQHMRGATDNPWDERFDWGNGDYIVAKSAIDFCKLMGIPIMQILPDRWSAAFHSPYSVLGNAVADPENINIPSVVATMQKNGIDAKDVVSFINENMLKIEGLRQSLTIDHELILQLKIQAMKKAWESFKNSKDAELYHLFESYEARQKGGEVEDDIFFYLMKESAMQKDGSKGWDWRLWTKWFPGLIGKNRFVIETMKNGMREDLRFHLFVQFFLEKQDNEFKQYADANNVSVMIDIPFAPPDATVFFHPELVSMDGQENQFQRVEVQGVPGKKETPLGQLWNFSIYRDRSVMERYFSKTFQQNQKRGVKFVRRDHVPGDFQVYAFRQDVKEEFRLDKLGIIDQINAIRETALKANTPEAKTTAGQKIAEIIKSTLMHPPAGIAKLPQDIIDLLFTPDGDMRTEGNMLMIARKATNGQKPPQGSLWTQVDQMEDGIFADAPKWDLLRITPNKRANDIGFINTWLFPEDNVIGPLPTDSIRVAYYKAGPGESILQGMDYLAQREGNSVVLETLGTVTNDMLASSQRPGGYPLIPLIWGLDSKGRYHPTKYQANNFAVYDVPDSQTPISAWEAESSQTKIDVLKLLNANVDENLARPTPAVYEQLLSMVMAPRKIFTDLPVENVPLLAGLSLQAYLMLDDEYRLNSPGHQISWFRALPHEASLQALLTAAEGQKSSPLAQDGVERIKRLRKARYEDEPQINPNEVKILNTRPNTNWSSVAVRRIDPTHPQDTDPFLVEAAIAGTPKSVTFVEVDRYGKELSRVAMQEMKGQKGHVEGVGDWMVSLRPTGFGVYRYIIEAERADGSFDRSKTGLLVAADNDTDLNYISGNFLKNVDDFRKDQAEKSKAVMKDNGVLTDGGINFDPAMMDMQTVRQGSGFAEVYGQPDLLKMDIQGLTPMIIGVKEAVNLPSLLGFTSMGDR